MGSLKPLLWHCVACHRVWWGLWNHGAVRPFTVNAYVNESSWTSGGEKELDYHVTLHATDLKFLTFVSRLLTTSADWAEQCSLWDTINKAKSTCRGQVRLWRFPPALAICHVGGGWQELQLLAYATHYPKLVEQATQLNPTVDTPGLARPQ